jgi:maltase-glucoamylase
MGDNESMWGAMRASITSMLTMSLHGFSHTGSDICGHIFDANLELCQRWTMLGAFYTFSRSHNSRDNHRQDPAYWVISGEDDEFVSMTRKVYNIRYSLLPYLYTLMQKASTTGTTVSRALFHKYPWDQNALDASYQFLWGDGLMIVPCVYPTKNPIFKLKPDYDDGNFQNCEVKVYFPASRFYDAYSYEEISNHEDGKWDYSFC